jgi:hypothetical protein
MRVRSRPSRRAASATLRVGSSSTKTVSATSAMTLSAVLALTVSTVLDLISLPAVAGVAMCSRVQVAVGVAMRSVPEMPAWMYRSNVSVHRLM